MKSAVETVPGVTGASVDVSTGRIAVAGDVDAGAVAKAIANAGYQTAES